MFSHLRIAAAVIATLGLLAIAPGVASATFISSQITSPSDPFTGFYDLRGDSDGPMVTVSGSVSSDATIGEPVHIRCVYPGITFDMTQTTVESDYTFQVEVAASKLAGRGCLLKATPPSDDGSNPAFAGPRLYGGSIFDDTLSSGPNAGAVANAGISLATLGGFKVQIETLGACGLILYPSLNEGPSRVDPPFSCAGFYNDTDGFPPLTSEITVDGHPAYGTSRGRPSADTPGMRPIDIQVSHDPGAGTVTLNETAIPQRCRDTDALDPDGAACGELVDTPVKVTREWKTSGDGKTVTLTETWTSTDGASHHVVLEPEADVTSDNSAIDFPWLGAGFQQYDTQPTLEVPPSVPGSLFVLSDTDTSNENRSYGSLTYSAAPQAIRFFGDSTNYPELVYEETVGPDQPFSFRWIFNASQSEEEVRNAAAQAQESLKPPPPPPPATRSPSPTPTRPKCRVPRLLHSQLRVAKRRLAGANCAVGKVRRVYRTHRVTRRRHGKKVRVRVPYRRGLVLAQKPKPGAVRPAGAKVNLVVQGRKPHRRHHRGHTRR